MLKIDDIKPHKSESRNFMLGEYANATRPVSQSFAARRARHPAGAGTKSVQRYSQAPLSNTFYSNNHKNRGYRNMLTQSYDGTSKSPAVRVLPGGSII